MAVSPTTPIRGVDDGCWPKIWRYGLAILWWVLVAVGYIVASEVAVDAVPAWAAPVDLVLGAVMVWAMRFRYRSPRVLVVVFTLLSVVSVSGSVPAFWALAHLATRRRWPEILALGGLSAAIGVLGSGYSPLFGQEGVGSTWPEIFTTVFGAVIVVAFATVIGSYTGARRDLIRALHERAEEAERRQELSVLQGQAEERNRIAREMHDVLAHRISLVSMHAGVLAYRDDLPAEQVREIAGVIQDNARQSMTELRAILGSLRQAEEGDPAQPAAPQPGIDQLETLFAEARRVGQRIEVVEAVEHAELLPTLTGRHCYRVVQELVTNARKHAPNSPVKIELTGAPGDGLTIRSGNPRQLGDAALPGSGVGLIGLRERASMLGGRMSYGVDGEGRFEVEVWFPW